MERRESSWGFEDLPGMEDGGAEGLVLKVEVQVLWNCSNCLVPTASKWWSFLTKHANAHLWMVLLVFQFFPMPWFDVALRFLLGAGIGETMLVMDFGRFVQRPCPPQPPRMENTRQTKLKKHADKSDDVSSCLTIFLYIQWYPMIWRTQGRCLSQTMSAWIWSTHQTIQYYPRFVAHPSRACHESNVQDGAMGSWLWSACWDRPTGMWQVSNSTMRINCNMFCIQYK